MRRAVNLSVLGALGFMLLLAALPYAAYSGTVLYLVLYALFFAASALMITVIAKKRGAEMKMPVPVSRKRGFLLSLPLIFPAVFGVMGLSFLTELLLSGTGLSVGVDLAAMKPSYIIFMYILIPSAGEEILFRYLPLKLISPHSRKTAVLASALIFSVVHANLLQIPHAFFAGAVFAFADIMAGSILPSLIMHLLNNTLSVFSLLHGGDAFFAPCLCAFAVLAVLSLLFIAIKNRAYREELGAVLACEGGGFTAELWIFTVFALLMALTALV